VLKGETLSPQNFQRILPFFGPILRKISVCGEISPQKKGDSQKGEYFVPEL